MRCKVGDLAVRVTEKANAYIPFGAIVEILDFMGSGQLFGTNIQCENVWRVRYRGADASPRGITYGIPDDQLRPIRDQPGNDETLAWSNVPKTTARKLVKA